jgi:hypothetical protein
MKRALETLFLVAHDSGLPGDGLGLGNSPWPGYIKPGEELKWLENMTYDEK